MSNEVEVESKLGTIARQVDCIMLAELGYSDIDCLNTFSEFAKEKGWCLAVSLKQAHLLSALRG